MGLWLWCGGLWSYCLCIKSLYLEHMVKEKQLVKEHMKEHMKGKQNLEEKEQVKEHMKGKLGEGTFCKAYAGVIKILGVKKEKW